MLTKILLLMEVKKFTDEADPTECIRYDWDGGHVYAYISHEIVDILDSALENKAISLYDYDHIHDSLNWWISKHEVRPPCEIHIVEDSQGNILETKSRCGCHDHNDPVNDSEYIQDCISELKEINPKGITREVL